MMTLFQKEGLANICASSCGNTRRSSATYNYLV